jgi:hypothetical protein
MAAVPPRLKRVVPFRLVALAALSTHRAVAQGGGL